MNKSTVKWARPAVNGDSGAIILSALCMVHCVALPILISVLPWLAWLQSHEELMHRWLLALIAPLSLWALSRGCAEHGRWPTLIGGLTGLAALVCALLLEPLAPALEEPLTVLGSSILVASHVWNLRALSRCHAQRDQHA